MNKTQKINNHNKNKTKRKNFTLNNIYAMQLNSNAFNNINFIREKNNINDQNDQHIQDNKHMIRIKTRDYTFIMYEEQDEMNYILYFMSANPKIKEPCLKIYIPKENNVEGLIEKLNHEKSCSIERELEEKEGTIYMLKTALKYIIDNYSHTKYFKLTDISFKKIPGLSPTDLPWITPRRLLQGSKGWYEEHFQATPTKKTKQLIDVISKNRAIIDKLIASNIKNELWNTEKIMKIAKKVDGNIIEKNILSTDWIIDNNAIKSYDINYEILINNTENDYNNIANVLNNAYIYNVNLNK